MEKQFFFFNFVYISDDSDEMTENVLIFIIVALWEICHGTFFSEEFYSLEGY